MLLWALNHFPSRGAGSLVACVRSQALVECPSSLQRIGARYVSGTASTTCTPELHFRAQRETAAFTQVVCTSLHGVIRMHVLSISLDLVPGTVRKSVTTT
jgi:hypothetical protein